MFDLSSQYALRSMLYLAGLEPGRLVRAQLLAEELSLPGPFLAKILQQLVRRGLIRSRKGPSGGFALARRPEEISLYEVFSAFQKIRRHENCVLGEADCTDENPCALHGFWNEFRQRFVETLRAMSLADVMAHESRRLAAQERRTAAGPTAAAEQPG
ncbi:MAG: Rrf2 family transcriptional regulator [Planctomycetes bacterium]|nr:Rrf2 family transcriptional regulator [Planctomycetota bacterium]